MEIHLVSCFLVLIFVKYGESQSTPGNVVGTIVGETYKPDLSTVTPNSFSLTFAFDTTGSMSDDLAQVKAGAREVLNITKQRSGGNLYNYVFIPFNDPNVGPTTVTSDPAAFTRAIDTLRVTGGGDCPEMSVTAIREALLVSLPNSYIYVFTDASAKDYGLLADVLKLIQQRQSQIIFFLTGHCWDIDQDSYKVYEKIAATSSGQVFVISKDDVSTVVTFIEVSVEVDKASLISSDFEEGGHHQWHISVDPELQEFSVSLSGPEGNILLIDPDDIVVTEENGLRILLNLKNVKVVSVLKPKLGRWKLNTTSTGQHSLRVTGPSSLDFQIRFSQEPTLSWAEAEIQPLEGFYSHVLINVSGLEQPGVVTNLRIEDTDGTITQEVDLFGSGDPNQPYLYTSQPIKTPHNSFHVTILGTTKDGYGFKRTSKTAIIQASVDAECGSPNIYSHLNWEQIIQYPGYPNTAGSSLECSYTVRSPNGTRIRFSFESFGITTYGSLFSVWCYDGEEPSERSLVLNEESQEGSMFHSASNSMRMKLRVPRSYNYTGFRFRTIAVDSGSLRLETYDDAQPLLSPGYPFKHLSNQIYVWTFVAAPDHMITLTANQTTNEICCIQFKVDGLKVSVAKGSVFQSSENKMVLEFISHNSVERNPFLFFYRSEHICGSEKFHVTDLVQNFQASSYPNISSNTLNCGYKFISSVGTRIRFKIKKFGTNIFRKHLFYLHVYDGSCENDERILILDDETQTNITFHSKSNVMFVKLRAYKPDKYTGFRMSYQAVSSCGSRLIASEVPQVLSSPGYPKTHPANLVCTWFISAPPRHVVVLNLNYLTQEKCCVSIEAFESDPSASSTKLNTSTSYYTNGNEIKLVFVSQNSLERSGFELSYFESSICGKADYIAEVDVEKHINPPGFRPTSSYELSCWYTLTAPKKTVIWFWLERKGIFHHLYSNYLKFYNSLEESGSAPFLILSGYSPLRKKYQTDHNLLGFKLQVHKYHGYTGFDLKYTAVDSCGENLVATESYQTISTPGYPANYRSNLTCNWTIMTSSDHLVEIKTNFVSNESRGEIYDIDAYSYGELQPYKTYTSRGTSLNIDFLSHNSTERKGFSLQYKQVPRCGYSVYKAEVGLQASINNPGFSLNEDDQSCWYYITSPVNTSILFWIDEFSVSRRYHSYMRFYNSLDRSNTFLYHWSSSQTGVMHSSLNNYFSFFMNLKKDELYGGFRLRYTAINSCGRTIQATSSLQTITTPNYPNEYESDLMCEWKITIPSCHLLEISLNYLSSDSCCEKVEGNFHHNTLLLQTNRTYIDGYQYAIINFISLNSTQRKGFELQFKTSYVCGKSELIASPEKEKILQTPLPPESPSNYYFTSCWFSVTSPPNKIIRVWMNKQTESFPHYHHYIRFYNRLEPTGSSSLHYINDRFNRILHSESNQLGIQLNFNMFPHHKAPRFNISYMAVDACGTKLAASPYFHQNISVFTHLQPNLTNFICTWTIAAAQDYLIELKAIKISNKLCCEQTEINVPFHKVVEQNQTYLSSRNSMEVDYVFYSKSNSSGIVLLYKAVHICEEKSQEAEFDVEKSLYSLMKRIHFGKILNCWYTITSPKQSRIRFYIKEVGHFSSYNPYELKFYDNFEQNRTYFLSLDYHSHRFGELHYSESNLLGIHLKGWSYLFRNFDLRYIAVVNCGSKLTASENFQTISTPNYPLSYPFDLNCTWIISTTSKYVIKLKTKYVSNDTCCENLKVVSPFHLSLRTNQTYNIYLKSISLDFTSHNSNKRNGIEIFYKAEHICGDTKLKALMNMKQQAQSPPYPTYHQSHIINCWYTITAPLNSLIRFTIDSFGIKYNRYSSYRLQFYDGLQISSRILLNFRYNTAKPGQTYFSNSNAMSINLYTNKFDQYTGMKITYEAIETCGGKINALDHPQILFPCGNASKGNYKWVLQAPCDHRIHLVPLQVFNRTTTEELYIKSLNLPKVYITKEKNYTSSGRTMEIELLAYNSNNTYYFALQYKTVHICGARSLGAELNEIQHVHPPAHPRDYDNHLTCQYTVRSPPGTRIQFKFASLGVNVYHRLYFNITFYDGLSANDRHFLTLASASDVNKLRHSRENVMTFRLSVDRSHVTYNGFSLYYSAVAVEKNSFVKVRVNFTLTYRISVKSGIKAKYLLNEYNTVDVNHVVFTQIQSDAASTFQLIKTEDKPSFNGTKILVRVDLKWTFEITINNHVINQYRFLIGHLNDVTITMFSKIREDSESTQLQKVDLSLSEVVSGSTLFIVRVDFQFTYKVLLINSLANAYGFEQTIRNEINSEVYKRLSGVANYIQLMKLNEKVTIPEERLIVRVDQTRLYTLSLSSTQQDNFKLRQDSLNDLSSSVFIQIRRNAELVQLVGWKTVKFTSERLIIRVDYSWIYTCVIPQSFIRQYDLTVNFTNDVDDSIYSMIQSKAYFLQLTTYQPTAPIPPLIRVWVDFSRIYTISASQEVISNFYLSSSELNEVSSSVFTHLKVLVYSAQLQRLTEYETSGEGSADVYLTLRVDYIGVFLVFLPYDAVEEYQFLINQTNDVSSSLFATLREEYSFIPELIKRDNITFSGYPVDVRVDGTHLYSIHLSSNALLKYDLTTNSTNDVSTAIFFTIRREKYICQLRSVLPYSSPAGIKIRIRVDFTRLYICYLSSDIKIRYRFYLKKINDISLFVFITVRKEASFTQLSEIQIPDSFSPPIKVRVDYNLKYNVYVSNTIKHIFDLVDGDLIHDLSETIFIQVQNQAAAFILTGTTEKDPRTQNKFTVRVDHDNIYEVYLSDDDVRSFPLVAGKVNDITTFIFKQVQIKSVTTQLISINNNPVTVTCRSGSWVYKVIIPDTLRVKYHLSLNQTNDVSSTIFTLLQEKSSSVTLVRSEPQNTTNTVLVKVRVDSLRSYDIHIEPSYINKYNLTINLTTDITTSAYLRISLTARIVVLTNFLISEKQNICPSNNWTEWFNRDDPSGPCDCETLPELRHDYPGQICEKPTTFQARLENCLIPYDPTLSNIVANVNAGFKCKNENGKKCLDYEVRFCCP